ncbi:hypothetical protein HPAG1_0741 [Helicobacter pylori HPAG1]|nr:hypothetical protein HPAG1_0741 [Helicobacter pylori HPAG1]
MKSCKTLSNKVLSTTKGSGMKDYEDELEDFEEEELEGFEEEDEEYGDYKNVYDDDDYEDYNSDYEEE